MRCIVFANLKPGQTLTLSGKRLVWDRLVYVSALRLDNGKLLILITPEPCSTLISDYGKRWGIETLFGMLPERSSLVLRRAAPSSASFARFANATATTICALC